MPMFDVTTRDDFETTEIVADYYVIEDGFVTFKDAQHKQVASFRGDSVLHVQRTGDVVSIGTVTVDVVPKVDGAAWRRAVEQIQRLEDRATAKTTRIGGTAIPQNELRDRLGWDKTTDA